MQLLQCTQHTLLFLVEATPERKKITVELHRQRIKSDRYLEIKIQLLPDTSPGDTGSIKLLFITLQVTPFKLQNGKT